MRILVTGASGNMGTALLRRLSGAGHDVVGVSRRRPPRTAPYDGVGWVECDIGADSAHRQLVVAMTGADAVVHLAWQIQPSHDRDRMRRTNRQGTATVAAAAAETGVGHLVHMSSIGTYASGAPGRVADETWPATGIDSSGYSRDKAAAEELLRPYEGAMTVTRLRPTLVLQPGAASEVARYFLGPVVPVRALTPRVLRFAPWPRDLALQFVHADDVAAAVELVLDRRPGGAFNVAADPVIDRAGFAELFGGVGPPVPPAALRALAAVTWRLRVQPTEAGWLDLAMGLPLLDTTRLRALGWAPRHSGADTLTSFVAALARGEGGPGPLLYPKRRSAG